MSDQPKYSASVGAPGMVKYVNTGKMPVVVTLVDGSRVTIKGGESTEIPRSLLPSRADGSGGEDGVV